MGTFLDKPVTDKDTEEDTSENGLRFGASAMQGWRVEMEDSHTIITAMPGLPNHSFVAVYDGHGGSMCATYAGKEMMRFLRATPDYEAYVAQPAGGRNVELLCKALHTAYLDIDEALQKVPEAQSASERSGCTALSAVITPNHIVVAHAGDSRAIICSGGRVAAATEDHKPYDAEEKARIEAAGGHVSMRRVDGDLAVSRALGDFQYKSRDLPPRNCKVTCVPDTLVYRRTPGDELLLLCCDGVWDVMNNDDCQRCAMEIFAEGEARVGLACEELIDTCLARGSRDNMSVVMVAFKALKAGKGRGVAGRRAAREAEQAQKESRRDDPDFDPASAGNSSPPGHGV